jgi:MFS family permease
MLTGGLVFGALGDRVGRKKSLLITLFINGLFGLLSAFAPEIYSLIVCRALAGVGIGGTVPAMFTLCTEHAPRHRRGFYVTIVASFWMIGAIFTATLAWAMLGNPENASSWRLFAAIVALPAILCLFLIQLYVPESAQYFTRQRQFSDAEEVLKHIYKVNGVKEAVLSTHIVGNGIEESVENDSPLVAYSERISTSYAMYSPTANNKQSPRERASSIPSKQLTAEESFKLIFDPVLSITTISLFLSWFCLSFGSYGLATWITVLFKRINLDDPFFNSFLFNAANLPGNLLSAFFMDKVGGRGILGGSMLCASICAGLFALANYYNSAAAIVALACAFNAFSTSGWNAIDLLSSESFPTDVRTTGMGFLSAGGRIGSFAAQFVNGYLVGPPPRVTLLLLITATMMLLGGASCFFIQNLTGKELFHSVNQMKRHHQENSSKERNEEEKQERQQEA